MGIFGREKNMIWIFIFKRFTYYRVDLQFPSCSSHFPFITVLVTRTTAVPLFHALGCSPQDQIYSPVAWHGRYAVFYYHNHISDSKENGSIWWRHHEIPWMLCPVLFVYRNSYLLSDIQNAYAASRHQHLSYYRWCFFLSFLCIYYITILWKFFKNSVSRWISFHISYQIRTLYQPLCLW